MFGRSSHIYFYIAFIFLSCISVSAQSADNRSPLFSRGEDSRDQPKGVKEMLQKGRIEKEKKDYDEVLERSAEARRLSEQVERAYTERGSLNENDMAKLESVVKTVKKIRGQLGGGDDDESAAQTSGISGNLTTGAAVKTLKETTASLFEEIKKSGRFSISVSAIEASNVSLRIARLLLRQ